MSLQENDLQRSKCHSSSRAELQEWTVDTSRGTASLGIRRRHRQLRPRNAPLTQSTIQTLAAEVAKAALDHQADPRVKFHDDGSFHVNASAAIPGAGVCNQTLNGRRKRLRAALSTLLAPHGYIETSPNRFAKGSG